MRDGCRAVPWGGCVRRREGEGERESACECESESESENRGRPARDGQEVAGVR